MSASLLADPRPAAAPGPGPRPWAPRTVLATPSALRFAHGAAMVERAARMGARVVTLPADRLSGLPDAYRDAKTTLAVVTASPSRRRPQPIPPSADWRFDLAEGCPAHCQYCYLAGSLAGPPIIRAYANLPEILAELPPLLGQGTVSSVREDRAGEGTTFECSCYTDPLGIEAVTGSLAETIRWFGEWDAPVQLRFTTKYDAVEPLLALPHRGRTRIRFSLNSRSGERFEGGAPRMGRRLEAMRRMAAAGYRLGLTVAPILPLPGWREEYEALFRAVTETLDGIAVPDLTAELITHRFTDKSKQVLVGWYPGSDLPMEEGARTRKLTKFGSGKWVLPRAEMTALRGFIAEALARHLPTARLLYWT
ncbi:MAG: radical SAM protein [Gluconacetobacter diazotrophicus]|nr:radical SAM protein [Gluconacetobacter diazotrophicus]